MGLPPVPGPQDAQRRVAIIVTNSWHDSVTAILAQERDTQIWKGTFTLGDVAVRLMLKMGYQVEDDTEILIRYNVRGRGPKFWTGT